MRIVLICLLLTGCAAFDPEPYTLARHISTITIKVDPMLGMMPDAEGNQLNGTAVVTGDKCTIVLREYPVCLAHEIRHCFEGSWHPKASATFPGNDDDCWQDGAQQNLR